MAPSSRQKHHAQSSARILGHLKCERLGQRLGHRSVQSKALPGPPPRLVHI